MFRPSTRRSSDGGINVAFINARSYNILQQHPVPTLRHTIFAFLISSLFNFLDLKYQGNGTVNPFQAYPIAMYVAHVGLFLYCFANLAELELRFTQLGSIGIGLFGSILSVSLTSVLFRNHGSFVLYLLCILLFNGQMLCSIIEPFWSWIHGRIVVHIVQVIRWIKSRWFVTPVSANRGGLQSENLDEFLEIV
ncbi:hypothetical protein Vadar_009968 [Vaccinium darrowii]|uniref:Uncharacterized protein n=1 Tax=Vaccinium darrowii TaxID=229202 RepID=A0ACB7ZBJ3_9ERIC|nr:hypothetical protein Vadar_009968 [Vaccinium darrowii]